MVDVIITDDLCMVPFFANKLAINDFISLIAYEAIERLDDGFKIEAFWDGIHLVLALRATVVVVGAFENEAQTFRDETNVSSLAPAQEVKSDLTETVVLAHVVHCIPPAVESSVERFRTDVLGTTLDTFEALKTRVL